MESTFVKLTKIQLNSGQVPGLPANPRLIKDEKFEKLIKSIQDDPEMLDLRELIVFPFKSSYVVIGGNMRLQAMKELGFKEAPCKILPEETPVEKLKAYTIKDNVAYGNNDWDALITDWDLQQLEDWGMDVPQVELPEPKEIKEVDIRPFTRTHILFSFSPEHLALIAPLIEKIKNTPGIEYEQSSN